MRPRSIIMFERLFLVSLVGNVVSFANGYDYMVDELSRDPRVSELGVIGPVAIGVFAVWMALYLLLWFLIARKAVNPAKWILIVLVALTLLALPGTLDEPFAWSAMVDLATFGFAIVAIGFLFPGDARAWLSGNRPTDPAIFD